MYRQRMEWPSKLHLISDNDTKPVAYPLSNGQGSRMQRTEDQKDPQELATGHVHDPLTSIGRRQVYHYVLAIGGNLVLCRYYSRLQALQI